MDDLHLPPSVHTNGASNISGLPDAGPPTPPSGVGHPPSNAGETAATRTFGETAAALSTLTAGPTLGARLASDKGSVFTETLKSIGGLVATKASSVVLGGGNVADMAKNVSDKIKTIVAERFPG